MTAHQFKIRQKKEKEETISFKKEDVKLRNTTIEIINKNTAKNLIIEYEWLKTIPIQTNYHFGIYFNINNKKFLGGVLIFSQDYAQNTGVWNKYGFEDKLILLSRGVCLWWTPKNTASYFISKTYKWLKKNTKYKIITATVDPSAGEIGTIYQSLNWNYVGLMKGNYNNKNETKRFSVLINGKLRYSRSIRKELGTMKKDVILEKYPDALFISQFRKRRYFYFIDDKINNKKYLHNIKHLLLPYPKRNVNVSGLIYKINNKINNKIYIGQTVRSLNDRINDYKNWLGNNYLNNAIKKYGWDNFEFSIIDTCTTLKELNEKEVYYIKKYNSVDKNVGYNIELGGNNSIPSEETLLKMSKSHKGIKQDKNWINNRISKAGTNEAKKYGKIKTDEEKTHLSKVSPRYWAGKKRDEETKRKISKTKKEVGLSRKQKDLICKKVIAYNPTNDNIIDEYESTSKAAEVYNISQSTISRRCTGISKNKGNVFFKYV